MATATVVTPATSAEPPAPYVVRALTPIFPDRPDFRRSSPMRSTSRRSRASSRRLLFVRLLHQPRDGVEHPRYGRQVPSGVHGRGWRSDGRHEVLAAAPARQLSGQAVLVGDRLRL